MSSGLAPRGPLPARVYWVRRAIVLGVPLLILAVIMAIALGNSSDGSDAPDAAATLTSQDDTSPETAPTSVDPTPTPTRRTKTPLAQPTGPCDPAHVVITPAVPDPITAQGLTVALKVTTRSSPACYFSLSAKTTSVAITSGKDDIWFSSQCVDVLGEHEVVARPVKAGKASIVWNLRRSDEECSAHTEWVRLGYYHVSAAPLGGEPVTVQFELSRPPAEVAIRTVAPKPEPTKKPRTDTDNDSSHRSNGDGVSEPNG